MSSDWREQFDAAARLAVWRAHGASEAQAERLRDYAASPLHAGPLAPRGYPLPDAPCVSAWAGYAEESRANGAGAFDSVDAFSASNASSSADASGTSHAADACRVLRRVLLQLRFPIAAGMSQDPSYLAATRRGVAPAAAAPGLSMVAPERLDIRLHPTAAGRVPVIIAGAREDFESLVRALTRRNEPEPVPPSMGACLVAGYNNWDRVAARRRAFEAAHPDDRGGDGWPPEFRAMVPMKALYQDRFMILSAGGYSATPADALGLSEADWLAASLRLRLAHECTHFVTRELIGVMRESLLDELTADYVALVSAFGRFQPEALLRFLGLEAYPRYREGGRLQNYRGAPPLSDAEMTVLSAVVVRAARTLGDLQAWRAPDLRDDDGGVSAARLMIALLAAGLEGMASPHADALLDAAAREARDSVRAAG